MPMPIRIIFHAAEGNFMLMRDFTSGGDAIGYARQVGFNNYEITTNYNKADWTPLDKTLDPTRVLSFMFNNKKRKEYACPTPDYNDAWN